MPPEKGLLFVVSSPSGAGKTTLTRRLVEEFKTELDFSISYTTRPPRRDERDGYDYHFVSEEIFNEMLSEDQFAEWAYVHGHRYGTANRTIHEALAAGRGVLFDIDYQGGRQLKARYPAESVRVFVLPPTMHELARRLRSRATDDNETIQRRLAKAVDELGHYHAYEYLIINDDVEAAYDQLRAVYLAARCRWDYQSHQAERLIEEAQAPEFQREIDPPPQ